MLPDQVSGTHYEDFSADVIEAARATVVCYDSAIADPRAVIPTPLHAAIFNLRQKLEGK